MESVVLAHEVHGSGTVPVVVLHGWFADRATFRAIRPYLDGDTFTYAFADLRGYGESRQIRGDYGMLEVAHDALALADHLGWDRFCVVGHSMGGKAAQVLAGIAGRRVRRIVGVSPVSAGGSGFDAETARLFARAAGEPSVRRAILDFSTGGRLPERWLDGMVRQSLECCAPEVFAAYLRNWSVEDLHERVAGCDVPALAVVGGHDPGLGVEAMHETWMRWFKRGEVKEFADSGHYAMDEEPLALTSAIEAFLAIPDPV